MPQPYFLTPAIFPTLPMPTYPDIRLALVTTRAASQRVIALEAPDHVHIATEGPLGLLARVVCLSKGRPSPPVTTPASPNTSAPACRFRPSWTYGLLRCFHDPAAARWCPLLDAGGTVVALASGTVEALDPRGRSLDASRRGRQAASSSICPALSFYAWAALRSKRMCDAFLNLESPGPKVIVGDGPALADLAAQGAIPRRALSWPHHRPMAAGSMRGGCLRLPQPFRHFWQRLHRGTCPAPRLPPTRSPAHSTSLAMALVAQSLLIFAKLR